MMCLAQQKKAKYDQFGHQAFDGNGGFGSGGFNGGMNMEDIFRNFGDVFGGGGGGFEGFFGDQHEEELEAIRVQAFASPQNSH